MKLCKAQHDVYAWLGNNCTVAGSHIAEQGALFKRHLGSDLKYHLSEHEAFREIQKMRDDIYNQFTRQGKALNDRKEKLFRSKDL